MGRYRDFLHLQSCLGDVVSSDMLRIYYIFDYLVPYFPAHLYPYLQSHHMTL